MKKVSWYILRCLIPFVAVSCIDEPVKPPPHAPFVNMAAFVNAQAVELDSLNPPVIKRVRTGNATEEKTLRNVNWEKELALFAEADLSKPALVNSYTIENTPNNVRIFRPKPGEDPDVQYLKVAFDDRQRIQSVEAVIRNANYLYRSEKRLQLQCRPRANAAPILYSYRVSGYQKLIFSAPEPFNVQATIQ